MITDNSCYVLCLTETWLKPNYYIALNKSTPPSYCYKHEPRQTGRGGGVATIYSDIFNVTQKTVIINQQPYHPAAQDRLPTEAGLSLVSTWMGDLLGKLGCSWKRC